MQPTTTEKPTRRRPLTVWELPSLLTPMHRYRARKKKPKPERGHFAAILGFIYRNRFAVASQIQRRFSHVLKSDRTTRRHLEEMQVLGLIDVAPTRSVGPLWPKVYFVAGRGVKKLREALAKKGKPWQAVRIDRKSRHAAEGFSAEHVLHEILITEFLLMVWQTIKNRPDLELLQTERRSLKRHPAYKLTIDATPTRLEPDAMFLFRQAGRGMMCCYVEMDTGAMNLKQLKAKFRRYEAWTQSHTGQQYLADLYGRHGATHARPLFRLLVIATSRSGTEDGRRLDELATLRASFFTLAQRMWLSSLNQFKHDKEFQTALTSAMWSRIAMKGHAELSSLFKPASNS